jgi:hypothetical protein
MAQLGSVSATPAKAFSASSYQNEVQQRDGARELLLCLGAARHRKTDFAHLADRLCLQSGRYQ